VFNPFSKRIRYKYLSACTKREVIRKRRGIVFRDRKAFELPGWSFAEHNCLFEQQGTSFSNIVAYLANRGVYPKERGGCSKR